MPDREKVIKGLEELYGFLFREYANIPAEESKIYYERTCAIRDAIAMLKEKEPKLLIIEEITGDGECWFEGINGACGYADCYMWTGSKEVEICRISMKPEYVSLDDFKKKWRCWSYRPTDAQRKAVKWE